MNEFASHEQQERGEMLAEQVARGFRATGDDTLGFGDLDALIRAYAARYRAVYMGPVISTERLDQLAEDYGKERALALVGNNLRQRELAGNLRRTVRDETLRVRAEVRELERRAA